MNTIKLLLVDDEPIALEILESYINKLPGLEIVQKCSNAVEAFAALGQNQVDVMFLDINMPEINGIDFLNTLKHPPLVVFTTAYSEYAVQSYECNAVDYLLKPISFERFWKALNKAMGIMHAVITNKEQPAANAVAASVETNIGNNIFVKSDGKLIKIDLADLWFVEGLKDYVRIWTNSGKITVHSTMKNFEEQLSKYSNFIRVHKSYIVNFNHIHEIDGNVIRIKNQDIAVGNTYRDEITKLFNKMRFA